MPFDALPPGLLSELVIIGDVALAMLLGGVIGYERTQAQKPAGLRTHMLIAGASALLMALNAPLLEVYAGAPHSELIRADPGRMVLSIVTGIGLVCAGTIIQRGGDRVEGLTTATSLLFVGAIGVAVAIDQLLTAILSTILVLLALRGIGAWEKRRHKDDA